MGSIVFWEFSLLFFFRILSRCLFGNSTGFFNILYFLEALFSTIGVRERGVFFKKGDISILGRCYNFLCKKLGIIELNAKNLENFFFHVNIKEILRLISFKREKDTNLNSFSEKIFLPNFPWLKGHMILKHVKNSLSFRTLFFSEKDVNFQIRKNFIGNSGKNVTFLQISKLLKKGSIFISLFFFTKILNIAVSSSILRNKSLYQLSFYSKNNIFKFLSFNLFFKNGGENFHEIFLSLFNTFLLIFISVFRSSARFPNFNDKLFLRFKTIGLSFKQLKEMIFLNLQNKSQKVSIKISLVSKKISQFILDGILKKPFSLKIFVSLIIQLLKKRTFICEKVPPYYSIKEKESLKIKDFIIKELDSKSIIAFLADKTILFLIFLKARTTFPLASKSFSKSYQTPITLKNVTLNLNLEAFLIKQIDGNANFNTINQDKENKNKPKNKNLNRFWSEAPKNFLSFYKQRIYSRNYIKSISEFIIKIPFDTTYKKFSI